MLVLLPGNGYRQHLPRNGGTLGRDLTARLLDYPGRAHELQDKSDQWEDDRETSRAESKACGVGWTSRLLITGTVVGYIAK